MKREQLIIAMDFAPAEDPTMDDFLRECGHLPLHPGEAFFGASSCVSEWGGFLQDRGADLAICRRKASVLAMRKAGVPVIGIELGKERLPADLVLKGFEALEEEDILSVYHRGMKIPQEIFRTERLVIREMVPSDYPVLLGLHRNAEGTEYMGTKGDHRVMEDFTEPLGGRMATEEMIRTYRDFLYPLYGMGGFLITDPKAEENTENRKRAGDKRQKRMRAVSPLIGRIDLKPTGHCKKGQAEVGYLIDTAWRRRGYAREALEGICQYAREKLQLRELLARVHPDNLPSQSLLGKLGFVRENRSSFGAEDKADDWHLFL